LLFSITFVVVFVAPLVGDLFLKSAKSVYGDSAASYFFHAVIQESLAT